MRIATAKETYRADEALFDTATQRLWLALFPFVADAYWLYLACLVAINVASATGLNILTGYTGLVSLGQAAFMGLGAYTVAVMELRLGTPVLLNLLGAGVVAMLGGLLVGIPSLRVKGLYLAISTIAASFIAHFVFANWAFTGGTGGLQVPPARLLGIDLDTSFKIYWLIVPLTALMVLGAANLFRTRIGRAFIAIRDRDISAEVLGIHLLRYKAVGVFLSRGHAGELSADHVDLLPGGHHRGRHGLDPGLHPGRRVHDHGARTAQAGGGLAAGGRRRAAPDFAGAHHRVRPADRRLSDLRAARARGNLAPRAPLFSPLAFPHLDGGHSQENQETKP